MPYIDYIGPICGISAQMSIQDRTGQDILPEMPYIDYIGPICGISAQMSIQDRTRKDRTGQDRTRQDRTGQDILPEMPYIDCIGHRRLHFGYCIQPPMQDLSPNVHSVMSMGEVGQDGTGQDRTGPDVFAEVAFMKKKFW